MQITLTNTGKRYNREWIFRHIDFTFEPAKRYAITGANGSGKSTLLQVIAGAILHSQGSITYNITNDGSTAGKVIDPVNAHKHVAFSAPYLELIEEMTAIELLRFHATFKPLTHTIDELLNEVNLQQAANKQIRYYSSGMKQRLKLAQAFFSDAPVLLLDEPTTNLDEEGIALYKQLINKHSYNKTIIISSNDKNEYDFCQEVISIAKYK